MYNLFTEVCNSNSLKAIHLYNLDISNESTQKNQAMKKNLFNHFIVAMVIAFVFTACAEPRYYRENHRHSDGYNHRHPVRAGVELDIHN